MRRCFIGLIDSVRLVPIASGLPGQASPASAWVAAAIERRVRALASRLILRMVTVPFLPLEKEFTLTFPVGWGWKAGCVPPRIDCEPMPPTAGSRGPQGWEPAA